MSFDGMERWVFCFRRSGSRPLTEEEKRHLRALAGKMSSIRWLRGLLAVLLGVATIGGIVLAAQGHPFAWAIVVIGIVSFFWSLAAAGSAETIALLYRRAIRLGEVDRYERVDSHHVSRVKFRKPDPYGDEEENGALTDWQEEEQFLELLDKLAGRKADYFETPIADAVLIRVEGQWVRKVVNVLVLPVDP